MIGLKSWTVEDTLIHSFKILRKHSTLHLTSSLRANCLAVAWKTLKWIDSFLCYRQQRAASCCKRNKIGLGPGLVWCPTGHCPWFLVFFFFFFFFFFVFSLYINEITADIDSEIGLFADDWVCYREIKDAEDTSKLQKDIDQLGYWARKWDMRFQHVKCNMMQITRKRIKKIHASYALEGTILENVEIIKYLGVTIANDLRWNTRQQYLH